MKCCPVSRHTIELTSLSVLSAVLQMLASAEMAYAASMQGNPYALRSMQQMQQQQQQQAMLGSLSAAANMQQQQYGLKAVSSMQQPYGATAAYAVMQQQQASPYAQQQGRQPLQASPDRLGITPMQLAMLQQQRMQQNRSPQLVQVPSVHSVTSSGRSWSDDQQ